MYTSGAAESRPSMAHAVMLGECPYSRAVERKFVRLPAWVIFYRRGRKKHVAMVRDMSRPGIFFYSEYRPPEAEEIEFVMKMPKWTHTAPIACNGTFARVESTAPGPPLR